MSDATPSKPGDFRDLLYADQGMVWMQSMTMGGGPQAPGQPDWSLFRKAAEHVRAHDRNLAVQELKDILAKPDVETRVRLWAWKCLRDQGEQPDAAAKDQVQGIVIEIPEAEGTDVLAVYADGSARHADPEGKTTVWGGRPGPVTDRVMSMIADAQKVVGTVKPTDNRLGVKTKVRVTLLTFGGLRTTEEDATVLRSGRSPLSPVFTTATSTIVALARATDSSGAGGE